MVFTRDGGKFVHSMEFGPPGRAAELARTSPGTCSAKEHATLSPVSPTDPGIAADTRVVQC
jgi:hypothetical protein